MHSQYHQSEKRDHTETHNRDYGVQKPPQTWGFELPEKYYHTHLNSSSSNTVWVCAISVELFQKAQRNVHPFTFV